MTNVSVVIASYNKREQLEKVLHSINTRVKDGDQIVIVDDGSSDDTQKWLERLALHDHENYPDTFFPENIGISITNREDNGYELATVRNIGIDNATNNCIVQIDDDYLLTGNILDKCRELYDPEKLFVIRRDEMNEDGTITRDKRMSPKWKKWKTGKNLYKLEPTGNPPRINSVWGMLIYSKETAREIGLYNTEYNGLWGCEDADFGTRFLYAGYNVLYYVGQRAVHLTHEKRSNRFDERKKNLKVLERELNKYKNS